MENKLKELFEANQEHPIGYRAIYSRITQSVTASILLSQIVYWDEKMQHKQFHKTDEDFSKELSMGISEFKHAKKTLKDFGIITTIRKGIPAKTYYKLDLKKLVNLVTTQIKIDEQVSRKTTNKKRVKPSTITEITAETTEYTTSSNNNSFSKQKNKVSRKDTNTLIAHLKDDPSTTEVLNEAIDYYAQEYERYLDNPHPRITKDQFERVKDGFYCEDSYDRDVFLLIEEYMTITDSWFQDRNVRSDYNIVHFTSGNIIKTHYFMSVH